MGEASLYITQHSDFRLRSTIFGLRFAMSMSFVLTFCATQFTWAQQEVIYPRSKVSEDSRQKYPLRLLNACVKHLPTPISFIPSKLKMQQGRALKLLERKNNVIDITWAQTTIQREQKLLPIRIPIDRGLIGWRLLLIRQDQLNEFDTINSLEQLKPLRAGQGLDWPDTTVLRNNHLTVATNQTYTGLFDMLKRGHIDYFPRSLMEINAEQQQHATEGTAIEPRLALQHPAALYFFVSPHKPQLAQLLHQCLNTMIGNGEFQALFNEYFLPDIQQADLLERRIFSLHNPLLPPETPLEKTELWFSPSELTP